MPKPQTPQQQLLDKAKEDALAQFNQNPEAAVKQFVRTLAGNQVTKALLTPDLLRQLEGIINTSNKRRFGELLNTLEL